MDIPGAKKGIRLRTVVIGINAEMYALHRNAVSKDSGEPMSRHITKYMAAATNPETTMTIVSMRIKDTESISSSTGCSPTYKAHNNHKNERFHISPRSGHNLKKMNRRRNHPDSSSENTEQIKP
jgi:hypothetical protein